MENFSEMSVKELKSFAKDNEVAGYSKMKKDELVVACTNHLVSHVETDKVDGDVIKTIKRRTKSPLPRDEEGKVVRVGKNLSGNSPYRPKHYYLDEEYAEPSFWSEEYRTAVEAAPNQVRLILKAMRIEGITSPLTAQRGVTIVDRAKENGHLASKIPSANLFAYYRRVLEALGVIHHE